MFREMRRNKQAVSREGCVQILKTENRGVLSVVGDEGYPYAIPMNFYYEEKEEKLYFHCAREGHKIDAIKNVIKYALPHGIVDTARRESGPGT